MNPDTAAAAVTQMAISMEYNRTRKKPAVRGEEFEGNRLPAELSIKTLESRGQNIMEKLNIHTTAELTKYAIREGLTTLE